MKRLTLLLALAATTLTTAAQKYSITGKAPKDARYVYLTNLQNNKQVDSVAVGSNRSFKFEGDAQQKPFAVLYTPENSMRVILDGNLQVDFEAMTLTGTAENQALHQAEQDFKPLGQALGQASRELGKVARQLMQEGKQRNDPRFIAAYEVYLDKMQKVADFTHSITKACPNHIFPAHYIASYAQGMEDEQLAELAKIPSVALKTELLKPLKTKMDALSKRAVGQTFTDLKMHTPAGVVKGLSDFCGKGNYVLVDFWASWCGPCRREMPAVKALYDKYHKTKGFDVVGVSLDDDKAKWTAAIKSLDLPWHHISDLKGWKSAATEAYGISSIPFTLLLDPQGKIVAAGLHAEELGKKLQEIYGE